MYTLDHISNFLEALAHIAESNEKNFIGGAETPYYFFARNKNPLAKVYRFNKSDFSLSGYYRVQAVNSDHFYSEDFSCPFLLIHKGDGDYRKADIIGLSDVGNIEMIATKSLSSEHDNDERIGEGIVYNKEMKALAPSMHDDMHFDHAIRMVSNQICQFRIVEPYYEAYLRQLIKALSDANSRKSYYADHFKNTIKNFSNSFAVNIHVADR
jgi:hypothetical protein